MNNLSINLPNEMKPIYHALCMAQGEKEWEKENQSKKLKIEMK